MNQNICWKCFLQDKIVKIAEKEYSVKLPTVKNNDGFSLTLEAGTREGIETFLCEGNFKSFRFFAHRGFGEKHDVYYVRLKSQDREWIDNPEDVESVIKQHAFEIKSALLNLMPLRPYEDIKVVNVLFDSVFPGQDNVSKFYSVEEL